MFINKKEKESEEMHNFINKITEVGGDCEAAFNKKKYFTNRHTIRSNVLKFGKLINIY